MCTNFSLTTKQNEQIIGRTMELGPDLKSKLFFRPAGYVFNQKPSESFFEALREQDPRHKEFVLLKNIKKIKKLYSWKGVYGYIAMNAFNQDIAADGMNTEGLTTGTMVLTESEYQPLRKDDDGQYIGHKTIFYSNLSNWILSNCANCQDVIDKLKVDKLVVSDGSKLKNKGKNKIRYSVCNPFKKVPNAMKFHLPVHDANGNNIVLEFVKGKLVVSDLGPVNVLTNDPLIAWQQTNVINNCIGILPNNVQKENGNVPKLKPPGRFKCNTFAQGTGFALVPGSSTPVDRFVRAAMMTNYAYQPKNNKEGTTLAFHILNTVDIPLGTSRGFGSSNVHDFTQWSTVSNLQRKIYSIRMYDSPLVFKVKLNELDLNKLKDEYQTIPVQNKAVDLTELIEYKYKHNN